MDPVLYIYGYVMVKEITFLTVGTLGTIDLIFDVVFKHKYGYSRWHRRNFGILIADPDSPWKLRPDDV